MPKTFNPHRRSLAPTIQCGAALLVITLAASCPIAPAADDYEQQFKALTARAAAAREKNEYEQVEMARRERWDLIKKWSAESNKADAHPLVAGYRAIYDADGDEDVIGEPGLVDRLDYAEAATRLKAAWKVMTEALDANAPILGEVATRLFELVHQAQTIYPDSINPDSTRFIMSDADLQTILQVAIDRDPCCVAAIPLREWIAPLDPREAFLRAEVRPTFQARQQKLVRISHPSLFPITAPPGGGQAATGQPGADEVRTDCGEVAVGADLAAGQMNSPKHENADAVLLPWHAMTEFVKADSLNIVLDDIDKTRILDLEWISRGPIQRVLPSHILTGKDKFGDPLAVLYGRFFYITLPDRHGRSRSAVLVIGKNDRWSAYNIDLLWRSPNEREKDNQKDNIGDAYEDLTRRLEPRFTFTLGPEHFTVYKFPAIETERLLRMDIAQVVLKNVNDLKRMRFSDTQNDLTAVLDILATRGHGPAARVALANPSLWSVFGDSTGNFFTSASVLGNVRNSVASGDKTRHPFISLTNSHNPLILLSPRANTKTLPAEISYSYDDAGRPFITLDDDRRLYFDITGPKGPCTYIEGGGSTAYMPLRMTAVPPGLVTGSPLGQSFVELLRDVGYSRTAAVHEIAKIFDDPTHIPDKFEKKLRAMAAQTRSTPADAMRRLLNEKGYDGDSLLLAQELSKIYFASGFRYILDARGNVITNRQAAYAMAQTRTHSNNSSQQGQQPRGGPAQQNVRDFPYDFRAQEGETSLAQTQIYSWCDYVKLHSNMFGEHVSKMISFHPCLPAMAFADASADRTLVHPADRRPAHLDATDSGGGQPPEEKDSKNVATAIQNGSPRSSGAVFDILREQLWNDFGVWLKRAGGARVATTQNDVAKQQRAALASDKILVDAIHPWMVSGDHEGAMSLSNLHAAVTKEYLRAATLDEELNKFKRLLPALEQWRNELVSQAHRVAVTQLQELADAEYSNAYARWFDAAAPILSLHLDEARDKARNRYFHRAIVFYNDLLRQLVASQQRSPFEELSELVPDTARAQRFLKKVDLAVEGARFVLVTQLELAGVLESAGLHESARYIRERVVNDRHFYIDPLIAETRNYVGSYGLRLSSQADATLEKIAAAAELAAHELSREATSDAWRDVPSRPTVDDQAFTADVARAAQLIEGIQRTLDSAGAVGVDASVERELQGLLQDKLRPERAPTLDSWLALRKTFLQRPQFLFQGSVIDTAALVREAAITAYIARDVALEANDETSDGFGQPVADVLETVKPDEVVRWCKKPFTDARKDSIAGDAMLLLAWYWMDHGEKLRARDALLALVEWHRLQMLAAPEGSIPRFLSELRMYRAMIASSSILADLPGISAIRVDFSPALAPLIERWGRKWVAAGHYGPHAAAEVSRVRDLLVRNASRALAASSTWKSRRYYFTDYRASFGAIPDSLAQKLLETPELFRPVNQQQVAAQGQAAVNQQAGRLVSLQDAEMWLRSQRVDLNIAEDVASPDVRR